MNTLQAFLLAALLALLPTPTAAQPIEINARLTGRSTHYAGDGDYDEGNPGLVVTAEQQAFAFHPAAIAGVMKNSYGLASTVFGAGAVYEPYRWIRFSVFVGAATGYSELDMIDHTPFGVAPTVVQSVSIGRREAKLTLYHIPGAVAVGVTFEGLFYLGTEQ